MPELPDIVVYIEHLERRITGSRLLRTDWPRSLEELEARYERTEPSSGALATSRDAPRATGTTLPKPRKFNG